MSSLKFLPQTLAGWASVVTAFATVGAVSLSLYYSAHRKKKFKIKSIATAGLKSNNPPKETYNIIVEIENYTEYKMEIKTIDLCFYYKKHKALNKVAQPKQSSCEFICQNEFIAPLGVYQLSIPIKKEWKKGSLSKSNKLILTLSTNMGKVSYKASEKVLSRIANVLENDK